MKGLENTTYILMLVTSTVIAISLVVAAFKWPRVARWLFFLLFAWASITNFYTSQKTPLAYLEYGELAWSEWYKDFINGWFANHIALAVGFVAACQALIAIAMLMKGLVFKLGALGAIIFLLSIVPLGVGSGFPSTLIAAVAMAVLLRGQSKRVYS
jgi:hypothetical protein